MEDTIIKRIMPNSLEAEQSVIGSMIMDKDAIVTAMEMLHKDDFYHQQYGILFDAMVELYSAGQPVDLVTLQNKLKEKDVPKEVSSLEFVRELITAVPTSANIKYYATIVSENAVKRRLIRITEGIENECYTGKESLDSILNKTEKDIFALLSSRSGGDFVPIRQVVMNALEKIEKASKLSGTVTGIPTGFIDLDYRTAGLQPSDLILVAARPSMGKTAFVLNIAQYVAFHEAKSVAIFSLEMSKEQLVNRLFSLESRVDAQALRTGNLSDADWEKFAKMPYSEFYGPRKFDDMDENILENILGLNLQSKEATKIEDVIRQCAEVALSQIRRSAIEPQSPMAFHTFARACKVLFRIGAAIELHRLGYKFERINLN